jgi:hypothetical protein
MAFASSPVPWPAGRSSQRPGPPTRRWRARTAGSGRSSCGRPLTARGPFANGFPEIPMVLGRLTGRTVGAVEPGEECVVAAWSAGVEGRKHFAGTALFGDDGGLRAMARATWIRLTQAES